MPGFFEERAPPSSIGRALGCRKCLTVHMHRMTSTQLSPGGCWFNSGGGDIFSSNPPVLVLSHSQVVKYLKESLFWLKMAIDAKTLAEHVCRIIRINYIPMSGAPEDREVPLEGYVNTLNKAYAHVKGNGFSSVLNEALPSYFERKDIFYEAHLQDINKRTIISAFAGNILDREGDYFICTTSGSFEGIDFYDSHIGKHPTLVRTLPRGLSSKDKEEARILIYRDNIEKAFSSLEPAREPERAATAYIDEIIGSRTSVELHQKTAQLMDQLRA